MYWSKCDSNLNFRLPKCASVKIGLPQNYLNNWLGFDLIGSFLISQSCNKNGLQLHIIQMSDSCLVLRGGLRDDHDYSVG